VVKKEAEEILKYEDLITEIKRMWNVKKTDISNNRSNWNHIKSFRKYLSSISGKHEIKGLQKTAILVTAHILRKVLM
jgi:hypothetical protein